MKTLAVQEDKKDKKVTQTELQKLMVRVNEENGKDTSINENQLLSKVQSLMNDQADPTGKTALVRRVEGASKSELELQNEGRYAEEFQVQNFDTGADDDDDEDDKNEENKEERLQVRSNTLLKSSLFSRLDTKNFEENYEHDDNEQESYSQETMHVDFFSGTFYA